MLDGTLAGDFRGQEGAGMTGVIFGDISTGVTVDVFDGAFAATTAP
ncbi:hypothetical protein ACJ5NV_08260 [Loktanella agnita]